MLNKLFRLQRQRLFMNRAQLSQNNNFFVIFSILLGMRYGLFSLCFFMMYREKATFLAISLAGSNLSNKKTRLLDKVILRFNFENKRKRRLPASPI